MKILNITQKGLNIDVEIEGFAEPFSCFLALIKDKEHLIKLLENAINSRDVDLKLINETNEKYNTWVKDMVGETIVGN